MGSEARIFVTRAGFSGAVLSRELASHSDRKIVVIDTRRHIGGNCYTERADSPSVMVHTNRWRISSIYREEVCITTNPFGTFGCESGSRR